MADSPSDAPSAVRPAEAKSFGALFARLWHEKARGATVEVFLNEGRTIHPDRFAPAWSLGEHGLFAVRDSDGSYTLTAVPWESVARVVVRGVRQPPAEFCD